MPHRGRPPLGLQHVEGLPGSEEAKARLKLVLATLTGEKTVPQACAALGVCESRFHELRSEFLAQGVAALEPKPLGRPPDPEPTLLERENLRLHRENTDLKLRLEGALIREELALVMPHVLKPARVQKKLDPRTKGFPDSTPSAPAGSAGMKPSSGTTGNSTT